ncbi:MAG TPA: DedA family protein [Gemmatimonadales bacterium]|nr:DedA family protein [Gemmatimonadales bacterium]
MFPATLDLSAVIHAYGGPLLFVWAALQGEAAVIVGGALATQGYWPWWAVWLLACVPAVIGHQLYFTLGRRYGDALVARLPARWQPGIERTRLLVQRHAARLMLAMRFAYGVRLPLPILCGVVGIAPLRFLRYNVATALIWALLFTWLGALYGAAATAAFGRVSHYETWVLLGSVLLGLAVHTLTRALGRRLP